LSFFESVILGSTKHLVELLAVSGALPYVQIAVTSVHLFQVVFTSAVFTGIERNASFLSDRRQHSRAW
jgi:hypothetical protein